MGEQNNCPGLSDKNYCLACNEIGDCQNFKSSYVTEHQRTGVLGSIIAGVKTKIGKLVILLGLGTIALDEITDYLVYKDLNSHSPNIEQQTEYFKEKERLDEFENFVHLILKIIISIFTSFILYLIGKKDEEINLSNEKSKNLELIISRLVEVLKTLKEKEALLNDALYKIEFSNSAKGAFLANFAHEFRGPLNVISGYAEMFSLGLLSQELNGRAKGAIQTILVASKHLSDLVDSILESTKIESGKITLNKEHSNISKSLRDVLQILVIEFDMKNITLNLSIDENIELNFDNLKIKQALINVIRNAMKFSEHNSSVDVSLVDTGAEVIIKIADNGMGIRAEDLDKLCTPFVQGENSVKGNIKGTGLGLAISKGIIEAHSGTFKIESEGEGKGTTVTITLPKN